MEEELPDYDPWEHLLEFELEDDDDDIPPNAGSSE
jgi:hypothetical protein